MASIDLVTLVNQESELNAFPVEGNLRIIFTSEPDTTYIKDEIFLVRVDKDNSTPNIGDTFIYAIGSQIEDKYDVIDYNYSLEEVETGFQITVDPVQPLLPNSVYFFVVSKDLSPLHYDVSKTVTLGGSTLSAEPEKTGSGEDATFEIEITQTSQLSSGSHIIRYTLRKDMVDIDTNVELNIAIDNVVGLNDTISAVFNPNIPYLSSEKFEITTEEFTRLDETLVQKIFTYIDSQVIQSETEKSTKIAEKDVIQFYEDFGWARKLTNPPSAQNTQSGIETSFQYPNRFLIELGEDIDETTLVDGVFDIDISYAFNNYLLPDMGLYNDSEQYIIKYGLLNPNTIYLDFELDTTDTVPDGEKYLLQKQ